MGKTPESGTAAGREAPKIAAAQANKPEGLMRPANWGPFTGAPLVKRRLDNPYYLSQLGSPYLCLQQH